MSASEPTATARLDPRTAIGAVRLAVADLDEATAFYRQAIGLQAVERDGGLVRLGAEPGAPLVELAGDPAAPPRPPGTTGLFHLAVLVPSRAELARALRRVLDAGWRFTGASDHLVSEALYLHDPEGNGIEIYRDRPRAEWPRRDGTIQMATEPLDLDGVMAELPGGADRGMPPGTTMGHVHLNVADLRASEAFYGGALGFEVTVRTYPGALFVSAGGYHHHVGMNTWAGEGAAPPPPGARGLRWFEVALPGPAELSAVRERLAAAGARPDPAEGGALVADPAGNGVLLRAAAAAG